MKTNHRLSLLRVANKKIRQDREASPNRFKTARTQKTANVSYFFEKR